MSDDFLPLTPAQRTTAAALLWYRRWLESTGRSQEELDGPRRPEVAPSSESAGSDHGLGSVESARQRPARRTSGQPTE